MILAHERNIIIYQTRSYCLDHDKNDGRENLLSILSFGAFRYLKDGNYLKPENRADDTDERFSEYNFTLLQDQKVMLQERVKTLESRVGL